MSNVPTTHSRFQGLDWYGSFERITLVGAGSIGSWAAYFLAKMGHSLFIFDDDKVEEVNLAGQNFFLKDVGLRKVNAVCHNLIDHNALNVYPIVARFTSDTHIDTDHVVLATDNITSRKEGFDVWLRQMENYAFMANAKPSEFMHMRRLYIDARLNPEHFQIFCVPFYTQNNLFDQYTLPSIEKYKESLFEEDEVPDLPCSAKYTSHTSAMVGSMIASIFANFMTNKMQGEDVREVPFLTEMTLPLMLLETQNI